ncbi:MAG: hypothetical protein AAF696_19605, partial [Bacteroidota bacterium]
MENILGRGSLRMTNGVETLQVGILFLPENITFYSLQKSGLSWSLNQLIADCFKGDPTNITAKGAVSFSNWDVAPQAAFTEVVLELSSVSANSEAFSLVFSQSGIFMDLPHGKLSDFLTTLTYRSGEGIGFTPESSCKLEFEDYSQDMHPEWNTDQGLVLKSRENNFRLDGENMIPVGTLGKYGLKEIHPQSFEAEENL